MKSASAALAIATSILATPAAAQSGPNVASRMIAAIDDCAAALPFDRTTARGTTTESRIRTQSGASCEAHYSVNQQGNYLLDLGVTTSEGNEFTLLSDANGTVRTRLSFNVIGRTGQSMHSASIRGPARYPFLSVADPDLRQVQATIACLTTVMNGGECGYNPKFSTLAPEDNMGAVYTTGVAASARILAKAQMR